MNTGAATGDDGQWPPPCWLAGGKIDDPVPLEIDQDAAVAVTTPEGKVINAEDAWRGDGATDCSPDYPEDRIRAGSHLQSDQDPCSCLTTQCHSNEFECLNQAGGATSVGRDDAGQALREDAAGTGGCLTEEPTDGELDGDGNAVPGKIGEGADVAAVHARGREVAGWTRGTGGRGGHDNRNSGTVDAEQIEPEAGRIEEEGGRHGAHP